jgi:flagellar motility protein MotE (MotC chaperone)
MAGWGHREMRRPRLRPAVIWHALAFVSVAIAGTASSARVRAQDGWAPVVAAAVPPRVSSLAKKPSPPPKQKLPLKVAASPPPLSPLSDAMPPLATMAAQTVETSEPRRTVANPPEPDVRLAREYCLNIADAAADARRAWQKKTFADLELEIAKRIELLEAKTAEYQRWLARRDEFSKKAQEIVVTIYARMKPEAAAAQLVAMDEETAAAVLTKLDPRNASAILGEMEPTQAARLTATINGAANVNLPGRSKAQPGDKRS